MDGLLAALDALAEDDLAAMFGPQLNERVRVLLVASNRLAAHLARAVRQGELTQAAEHDGARSMASWLRGHGHLSPAAAARLVRTGRALEQLPAVEAAFLAGAVTADPCGRAEAVASSNGARLLSCAVEGRAVRVVVGLDPPTRLGPAHELTGTAVAGPG